MSTTPAASTSRRSMPYSRPTLDKSAKKSPACDACKLRHVLCRPVTAPGSCPACIEKGIVCTTTAVVRRKRAQRTGSRIEQAKATFGALETQLASPQSSSSSAVSQQHYSPSSSSETQLAQAVLRDVMSVHLLTIFMSSTHRFLPIFLGCHLFEQFEAAGYMIERMKPQTQVLASTIMAFTSRYSAHPLLIGSNMQQDPFGHTDAVSLGVDLQNYGRHRNEACCKLKQDATRLAWVSGALVEPTKENAITCYLLDLLDGWSEAPTASRSYASAFVSHTRATVHEAESIDEPSLNRGGGIYWSSCIMRDALASVLAKQTVLFTPNDDLDLCGPSPPALQDCLLPFIEDAETETNETFFFVALQSYFKHVICMARECSDNLVGSRAARHELDRDFLSNYLDRMDQLHTVLGRLMSALDLFKLPSHGMVVLLAGSLEDSPRTQRQLHLKHCYYFMPLAWGALILPVYMELDRRSRLPVNVTNELERRKVESQRLLFEQTRRMAIRAAKMVVHGMQKLPSPAYLTHLDMSRLRGWTRFLLEVETSEDPNDGFTKAEKIVALERMLHGLKILGWSWPDKTSLADVVEEKLAQLRVQDFLNDPSVPLALMSSLDWIADSPAAEYSGPYLSSSLSTSYNFPNGLPRPPSDIPAFQWSMDVSPRSMWNSMPSV